MRKFLLSALLLTSFTGVFAQKLDDVQESLNKGKYTDAKDKIDKFLSDPKNQSNANAWYYKGRVYSTLARVDSTNQLNYDATAIAYDAFKKYQELDPKNTLMTLDQNVGLFQAYDTYYNKGVKYYNAKDYANSFDNLKKALDVENYIAKRGYVYNNFKFPTLDTNLVNLTATSAYLAKKEDESIPYFQQLADANLSGKEYKEVYGVLAQYYLNKGDQAKADKYIAQGKQLFPDNEYWVGLEFGNPGTDTLKRFARYEQMLQKYPDNYALAMDYAAELYNYTYSNDKKPGDFAARQAKLQAALTRAINLKSTAFANFVMSQHVYNQIFDLQDALRAVQGNSPASAAKRRDYNTKISAKYEEMLGYAQKSYDLYTADTNLKIQDKANLRKVIDELIDYYERKKQQDKVTFYTNKLKSL